jgi:light-regulated signal transduction histidine kinase (bacteriophytochrome)/CheY-like chemotaxis protein
MNPPSEPEKFTVDLSNCDREPIHIPGSVQPHGVLLGIHPEDGTVAVASQNSREVLGVSVEEILGRRIEDFLDLASFTEVQRVQELPDMVGYNPLGLTLALPGKPRFDGIMHRSGGLILLELEPCGSAGCESLLDFYQMYNQDLIRLQNVKTAADLFRVACETVKRLTGFDRVWLYQFDADWNGAIVAEEKADHLPSYQGLHYPASDIPKQARALYRTNRLRLIADVNATPAPLVPDHNPRTGKPLDLTLSVLRSISPIHIEYMQNMGVTATLTISLIKDGELIGLISCHDHRGPAYVPYEIRRSCEFLGFVVSQTLSEIRARDTARVYEERGAVLTRLNEKMESESDLFSGLLNGEPNLRDLIASSGVALLRGERMETAGWTPAPGTIQRLVEWLRREHPEAVFFTDRLGVVWPEGESFSETASGVLVFNLSQSGRDWVIWFREEVVQTVEWGGDPNKPVAVDPKTKRLHPRKSFEKWKQVVRGRSLPWEPAEVAAIRPFWNDLIRHLRLRDLEARRRMDQRLQQVQKLESLGVLAGGVAHDFNNLLQGVMGNVGLALMDLPADSPATESVLHIESAARRLADLTNQLLAYAGRGKFNTGPVNLAELMTETAGLLRTLLARQAVLKMAPGEEAPVVRADPTQMRQVLMNLITNASEAIGEEAGTITVRTGVSPLEEIPPDEAELGEPLPPGRYAWVEVADTGSGMDPETRARMFDPFYSTKFTGRGLGLAAVLGIVRGHRGALRVWTRPGRGTTIRLILPWIETESQEAPAPPPAAPAEIPAARTILVVDDEPAVLGVTRRALERGGYRVLPAEDGFAGVKAVTENPGAISLVILDLLMPKMDGEATLREIRALEPELPVLLSSGYTDNELSPEIKALSPSGFIKKPYLPSDLLARVGEILSS